MCLKDAGRMVNSKNLDQTAGSAEVSNDPKIAGRLQKNSSGHAIRFFFEQSQNFEISTIIAKNL